MTAISVERLCKSFGARRALDGVSFTLDKGDVFGLLGPNGAGKTTTLRILATLLQPDAGTALILGHNIIHQPGKVRPVIGYMPDTTGTYRDMVVHEYLEFFAAAYHIPASRRRAVVQDCIVLTGLQDRRNDLIESLSRGMRQRLGLARCLVHDPKVLLLDEPASGLDPRSRIEVIEILRTLAQMDKTIVISSHILSELRQLCNKMCIIDEGRMVYCGTLQDAIEGARTSRRLEIRLRGHLEDACAFIAKLEGIEHARLEDGTLVAELEDSVTDFSFVARRLVEEGFALLTLREEEVMLEEAFLHLTRHSPQPAEQE